MRMRRKDWMAQEVAHSPVFLHDPYDYKGRWHDLFEKKQPLHLELGCGKGEFISKMGVLHPELNFLGIDLTTAVLATAHRKVMAAYDGKVPPNVRLTAYDIGRLADMMDERDAVERIYINFCNPWPKDRHKKRRLTHPKQLALYKAVLRPGGEIHLKTDDDALFMDSLEYFKEDKDFTLQFVSEDLHKETGIESPMTEHEAMFTAQGIKTKYVRVKYR